MYATINDNRLDITHSGTRSPDARGAELDVDTVFNELVADASTPTLDAGVVLRTPQARCADGNGTLTHLFFSDDVLSIARAKAICSKCKLAPSCLDGALDRAEPWGVWGGELIDSGRIVVNKRPRGRPPKNPRPILVIDEVPIPPHLVA
ncbi:MAG: WhiB family transcriptional regulator [Actinomycetota bacterium]|jgi:WhiB family redox-sensing transcriptional regulator